jgi:hypothetical protein
MKKLLLIVALLSSLNVSAQEKYIQLEPTVRMVITDEPCGEGKLHKAYAVETLLNEVATGCWFRSNGEVMIRLQNGNHYYDYRYLEGSFRDVE